MIKKSLPLNFALVGAAGYVAPKHLEAIKNTGSQLIAAVDPHDSVGILDRYFPNTKFFSEFERFDRYIEKLRRGNKENQIDYVSICSPNYLHDAHIRFALRVKANAICEKPLVLNPWNLDALSELEQENGKAVNVVLQLRLHPEVVKLKESLESKSSKHEVILSYVTPRGPWYQYSWKGQEQRSGGLSTNIGIHLFDLLIWLFGDVESSQLHLKSEIKCAGHLELERARIKWFLSTDHTDLPQRDADSVPSYRLVQIDGKEFEFSDGFTNLHTKVYEEVIAGRGFGINDARPSIELAQKLRSTAISQQKENFHPWLT